MKDFFIFALSLMLIVMSILMLAMLFELISESDFYRRHKVIHETKRWWRKHGKDTWGCND